MAKTIKTTFRLKRGDASVWATKNPVLDPGEPGFEIDTGKLKIGNGETEWINLPYINTTNGESTPTPGEDESAGVFYFDVELIQDEQDEDKFEANITESIKNIVSAYNEGKQIFAKCQYGNNSDFTTISLFSCEAIGKHGSEIAAFLFSGREPNTGGQATLIIQSENQNTTTQFNVAQFVTEKNVEELEDSINALQTTLNNLPRGIRFLGKGNVLPPFEGGEIENGDIYLVGDKEYIAYNETWYELGDYGAYVTQSDLNTKVDKVTGKGLSTEDYTTAEKTKLAGIDMTTKANVADLGDLAYRSLGAVSDSNTTSPPSGAAVKAAIDTATSEVGSFVEDAINQAIIGAMNASY